MAAATATTAADKAADPPAEEAPLTAEAVFDAVGAAYEDAFSGLPEQAASVKWLLSQLPKKPSRIVDIGCGTGRPVVSALAEAGHAALGIDISGAMVAAARERVPHPGATFEQVDVRDFLARSPPASFDAATAYFSLIAGVTQADIRAVFAGVFRLLRPGGLFVFATVPIPAESAHIRWMGRPVVVSSLAADDAVDAVRAAGFAVEHRSLTTFTPRAVEAGICAAEDVWEETHLFVYARKPADAEGSS